MLGGGWSGVERVRCGGGSGCLPWRCRWEHCTELTVSLCSPTLAEVYLNWFGGSSLGWSCDYLALSARTLNWSPGTSPAKHTTSSTPPSAHLYLPYSLPRDHVAFTTYQTLLSCPDRSLIRRKSATATKTQRTVASDFLIPEASVPASEVGGRSEWAPFKGAGRRTSADLGWSDLIRLWGAIRVLSQLCIAIAIFQSPRISCEIRAQVWTT